MNPSYDQMPMFTDSAQDFAVGFCRNVAELDAAIRESFLNEGRRCRYPSKRCEHPRAIKRDGQMHRFCDAHRNKANQNQRRLEARRKLEVQTTESSPPKSSSPLDGNPESKVLMKLESQQPWSDGCESPPPLHTVLAQDELKFLGDVLSQHSLEDFELGDDDSSSTMSSTSFNGGLRC